ncbi:MAG: prolyl oligopeptidase family serine peptidase [Bacteroidetes bacterium]|nr:prolyl oligopeptidase family serine peptidase [Bacteroidota bacterium]
MTGIIINDWLCKSTFLIAYLLILCDVSFSQKRLNPPRVLPSSSPDTIDQIRGVDPYNWLKNKNDSVVLRYIKSENAYTDRYFDEINDLRDSIYRVFLHQDSLLNNISHYPEKKGGYYYSKAPEGGKRYFIHCRTNDTTSGISEIVLDENELAVNSENFSLSEIIPSPDDKLLAVLYNYNGNRSILKIRDLRLKAFTDSIEDIESCAWSSNSKSVILTNSENQVIIHQVRTGQSRDKVIYTEKDDRFMIDVTASSSRKFIFITSYNNETTEVRYVPSDLRLTRPRLIQAGKENMRYFADHFGSDCFWIFTNSNAPGNKIVKVKIEHASVENWEDVIRSQENINIITYDLVNDEFLVLLERENLEQEIRVVNLKTGKEHLLPFPKGEKELTITSTDTTHGKLTIELCNFINPGSTYEYDLHTLELKPVRELHIKGYDPSKYALESLWIHADSGILIPATLMTRKDRGSGRKPLYLESYGAYNWVYPATFMSKAILMLDQGFYVVFAYPRGGGELGPKWWEGGRLMNKKNTFTDYIRCAEYLVEKGYTSKGEIIGSGGSEGGLIMGYVANERPDLFKGLIFSHPEVDPLTSQLDSSSGIRSPNEWLELGNPNQKTCYDYIKSYAPYNNVKPHAYPAMYFITGLLDNNVDYSESLRMVALLRQTKTDQNVLLLRIQMKGTHFGESGNEDYLHEASERFAFILNLFRSCSE